MTFKALSNIIKKHKEQPIQLARQQEQEMVEAKAFMNTLYGKHIRAYQERKQKWFKEHSEKQYFEPTLEEVRRDMQLDEWIYYYASRLCRTPEQRYQDAKFPTHGWNHFSDIHSIDDSICKPGCRFWPETGRIEALEILEDYKQYNGYDEVRKVWQSLPSH